MTLTKNLKIICIKIFLLTSFKVKKTKFEFFEKKNKCVDRIYFINFKADEIFYFRLLLCNRKKIIFFKNFCTVNMQIKNAMKKIKKSQFIINKKIYVTLNLTDNNKK